MRNESILFASDLDNTLLFSHKHARAGDVCVEYLDGKAETMAEGVKLAARLIDSGAAMQTLEKLIEVSNRPEADA